MTHLPCRAACYTPASDGVFPAKVPRAAFPVTPGAEMPPVDDCAKQDYAVVFVIGLAVSDDEDEANANA